MQRLQSLDVPASLVDDFVEAVKNAGDPATSGPSQQLPAVGQSNGTAMTNGTLEAFRLPNGTGKDAPTSQDKPESDTAKRRSSRRMVRRDDGYFAENPQGEDEWWKSTHIRLDATAADGGQVSVTTVEESSSNSGPAPPPEFSSATVAEQPPIRRSRSSRDGSTSKAWIPQAHRTSSPPALQSGFLPPAPFPQPGKLARHHTLEVPQASHSRLSKDTTRPSQDDAILPANNLLSPNVPGTTRRTSVSLYRRMVRSAGHSDLNLDDAPPSEDADKWAEMIRQKRASKRRRERDDDDDRVLMGTKVDQNHVNYVIAYNMLTGIRFTVSRTNAKLDRELTDADFVAAHKFSFDVTGNELTPSARYDFKFKDYAPWVFRHLRSIFRLDPADYLMSLTSKYILSELGSPGKSGSFFYFSRDYKYIIKTIHHSEHKALRKILKEYYHHVKTSPNTLLSQFYGLHRVKIPYGRKIHFVVMNNLFPPHRDIHNTFDLKGSTFGRDFKEEELEKNPRATLKDLNWIRRDMHLELGPTKKHQFILQMEKDVALLQKLKIMDYSLLVGIHDLSRGNEDNLRDKTLRVFQPGGDKGEDNGLMPVPTNNGNQLQQLMRTPSKLESQRKAKELRETLIKEKPIPMGQAASRMPSEIAEGQQRKDFYFYSDDGGFRATHENNEPGEQIYYLGIIDCLTHYGIVKRLEHFFKGFSQPESQISAIPPDRYGDRFVHFISGTTMSKELAERNQSTIGEVASNLPEMQQLSRSRPTSSIFAGTGPSGSKTDRDLDKAEKQAKRSGDRETESAVPERILGTINTNQDGGAGRRSMDSTGSGMTPGSANAGRDGDQMLPVVEEVGEGTGSLGGESGRSSAGPEESVQPLNSEKDAKSGNLHNLPFNTREQPVQNILRIPLVASPSSIQRNAPLPSPSRPPPTPPSDTNHLPTITTTGTSDVLPIPANHHPLNDSNDANFPRQPPTPPRYETEDSPDYEGTGILPPGVSDSKEMLGSGSAMKSKIKGKRVRKVKSSGTSVVTADKMDPAAAVEV